MSNVVRIPKGLKGVLANANNPPSWLKAMARERREQKERWFVEDTPFPVGQKKVYLPRFAITLLNTPGFGPRWAQFVVPMWFNKLDMRDFLFHAYGERCHSVRSHITYAPIMRRNPNVDRGTRAFRYRARASKKMAVELERPFEWPALPEDMSPWEQDKYDKIRMGQLGENLVNEERRHIQIREEERMKRRSELREEYMSRRGPQEPKRYAKLYSERDESIWTPHRHDMREQAEKILKGQVKWGRQTETSVKLPGEHDCHDHHDHHHHHHHHHNHH